jgi:1-acyl-sn-glycerol-3-phosphate acyltransferase
VTLRRVRAGNGNGSEAVAPARWGGAHKGLWVQLVVALVKPLSTLLTRRDWRGRDHVPRSGAVILAVNHVSYVDPPLLAHFVYGCGRIPRYLAKIEIFRVPVVGRIFRGAGQIPVLRHTPDAAQALSAAVEALEGGECLVIYPEGTITKDPQMWPMRARTGVARLALMTGAPVIPVAQWGAQDILGRDGKVRLLPRRRIRMMAGPPVDLSRWQGAASDGQNDTDNADNADNADDADTLRAVTDTIMARIAAQLAEFRGEPPPGEIWDPTAQAYEQWRTA